MSFRIEEKIKLTKYEESIILARILSLGAKNIYSERIVQSIYFDNRQRQSFLDAEEGVLPRKKVRIRNYPSTMDSMLEEKFYFEMKTSSVEGRFKTVREISWKDKKNYVNNFYLDNIYGLMEPILIVRYKRKYFSLGDFRLTLDSDINYISLDEKIKKTEKLSVMEIKADIKSDRGMIEKIFPYSRSRFSKYCNGILMLDYDKVFL